MTNQFSFKRLLLLIRKQAIENLRLYLLSALALLLILSLVFILTRYISYPRYAGETVYIIYIFGLIIAGALFASFSFQQLASRDKAIYYLSFPASKSEKLLCVLFFNVIVFPIIYTLIFWPVQTVYVAYLQSLVNANPGEVVYMPVHDFGFMRPFPYFFYAFFAIQAFYILGSVYFTRFSFIKTTIIGCILVFLFVWYVNAFVMGKFYRFDHEFSVAVAQGGDNKIYQLSAFARELIIYSLRLIWAPVFWVATYFRLKETEV